MISYFGSTSEETVSRRLGLSNCLWFWSLGCCAILAGKLQLKSIIPLLVGGGSLQIIYIYMIYGYILLKYVFPKSIHQYVQWEIIGHFIRNLGQKYLKLPSLKPPLIPWMLGATTTLTGHRKVTVLASALRTSPTGRIGRIGRMGRCFKQQDDWLEIKYLVNVNKKRWKDQPCYQWLNPL